MLTVRAIYDNYQKSYLQNLYENFGTIPDNHMKAIKLRQEFFNNFILSRVNNFKLNFSQLLISTQMLKKIGHILQEK
jgi:hypothetical protein